MFRTPRDLAERMAARRRQEKADDGYARETFTQPREQARQTARAFLDGWPAAAYMSAVDTWRKLPGGETEFTIMAFAIPERSVSRRVDVPIRFSIDGNDTSAAS